jgi:hypothetical protein
VTTLDVCHDLRNPFDYAMARHDFLAVLLGQAILVESHCFDSIRLPRDRPVNERWTHGEVPFCIDKGDFPVGILRIDRRSQWQ